MVQSPPFPLRKQEPRRNLCPTQWLALAGEVWYLSHTGDLLTVVTQHAFKGHLLVLRTSAATYNNNKKKPSANSTSTNLPACLCSSALQQRRRSDLLRANHRESAAMALKVTQVLPALWGQVGRSRGILRRAAGTEWSRQEGELFLSGLCCSKVSAQAYWAEGRCRTSPPTKGIPRVFIRSSSLFILYFPLHPLTPSFRELNSPQPTSSFPRKWFLRGQTSTSFVTVVCFYKVKRSFIVSSSVVPHFCDHKTPPLWWEIQILLTFIFVTTIMRIYLLISS